METEKCFLYYTNRLILRGLVTERENRGLEAAGSALGLSISTNPLIGSLCENRAMVHL